MTQEQLTGMIGLEIHTYLVTKQKLFCTCTASRERGLQPNINICPLCTGQPGAKPKLPNSTAVEKAVQIGLMLGCAISQIMPWFRKHYDWPDMPKGFQTTLSGTHAFPIGTQGKFHGINVSSMHLEEDPASWNPETGEVDYNRSGLPLVEIITAPEFSTAEEVVDWLKHLLHNLAYLKAADTNAGIKVDVNVSIPGKTERVEIKNINSLESIEKAINYELERQLREGNKQRQTRRYDEAQGITQVMRTKEGQADYRFIIDPDLIPIHLTQKYIAETKITLPETPEQKLDKLIRKYHIDAENAQILAKHRDIAEFFEQVAMHIEAQFALPWITVELLRLLNEHKTTLDKVSISAEHLIALLKLIKSEKITPLQGKQILKQFYPKSFLPSRIEEKITDENELSSIAKTILANNPGAVESFRKGETKALDFLMGEMMKATQKRADYRIARNILENLLKK